MLRRWGVLLALCLAGPSWAGQAGGSAGVATDGAEQAWVAQYRLRDGHGERTLTVVRDANRVEYRMSGEPVRIWRRVGDGVEHRQVFLADHKVVVYTPGDLRALGHAPDWAQLGGLVDPAVRGQLQASGEVRVAGHVAQRYRGSHEGARIELAWLQEQALPARYRRNTAKSRFELTLHALDRRPAGEAFTATDDYRELDYADIGDMELDPFARRYILQGF
jgi:hypothetical protein